MAGGVEVAPEIFADHAEHDELHAREEEHRDHEGGPARHLKTAGDFHADDHERVQRAQARDPEADDEAGAEGQVRERGERVDEVLDLLAESPPRPAVFPLQRGRSSRWTARNRPTESGRRGARSSRRSARESRRPSGPPERTRFPGRRNG